MTLWLILAWLPVTFFVHCLIHEGAHWLALRAFGHRARIVPYPHLVEGHLYFARTIQQSPLRGLLTGPQKALMLLAPVLTELVWLSIALGVAIVWPWALLEAASALVDLLVWCSGLWTRKPQTDAARLLEALK